MRCQLLLADGIPVPLGAREFESLPQIGEILTAMVEDTERRMEVAVVTYLPVVKGGLFAHDEAWIICRPV